MERPRWLRLPSRSLGVNLLSIVGGFALWEAMVAVFDMNRLIVSPPSQIWDAFLELEEGGVLWGHVRTSLNQFAVGYVGAAALGVLVGLLVGQFRIVRNVLEPWILALYATPNIALAPLFIVWLGFGFSAKASIIAFVAFFPVAINTIAGVDGLQQEWHDVASAFRANAWERFSKVNIPGALPYIFTGLRLGIGRAVVGIVVADFFGASEGLGFLILRSAQIFRTADIFVATIALAAMGVLFTGVLRMVERVASPWRFGS